MNASLMQEDKTQMNRLRNEINEWKKKYYDCRRKVVAQTQYVMHLTVTAALRLITQSINQSINPGGFLKWPK